MNYIGKILRPGVIELVEPKNVGGFEQFKIEDNGNIAHFRTGCLVKIDLVKISNSQMKVARIISIIEEQSETIPEATNNKHTENVLPFNAQRAEIKNLFNRLTNPLHFYIVFNPMLNREDHELIQGPTQAHSFFNLLHDRVKNSSDKFLYWGKLRSTHINEKLDIVKYLEVLNRNKKKSEATHLYISDFNNLWCAKVEEVVFELDQEKHAKNTLQFYNKNWDKIEAWFKITDMLLISNDNHNTIEFISKFHITAENKLNSRQDHTKTIEVTPYLSGLRYPLIIEDSREEKYFSLPDRILERNVLLEKCITVTEEARTKIYSYVIPEVIFKKLSSSVQKEILSAEIELNSHNAKTQEEIILNDFSIARKYLIALERSLNDVMEKTDVPSTSSFYMNNSMTLAEIDMAIRDKQHAYLAIQNPQLFAFLQSLIETGILLKLKELRNSKVHLNDVEIDHNTLINIRRKILGIGSPGLINQLYQAAYEECRSNLKINQPKLKVKSA